MIDDEIVSTLDKENRLKEAKNIEKMEERRKPEKKKTFS